MLLIAFVERCCPFSSRLTALLSLVTLNGWLSFYRGFEYPPKWCIYIAVWLLQEVCLHRCLVVTRGVFTSMFGCYKRCVYIDVWLLQEVCLHRCLVVTWLVPLETAAISARSVYTIQPCTIPRHFMQSHVRRLHAFWDVSGHLDVSAEWPVSFTCYYGNTGVERIPRPLDHESCALPLSFPNSRCERFYHRKRIQTMAFLHFHSAIRLIRWLCLWKV